MTDILIDTGLVDQTSQQQYTSRYTQFPDASVAPYAAVAETHSYPLSPDGAGTLVQNLDTTNWRAALLTLNLGGVIGNLQVNVLAQGQSQAVPVMIVQIDGSILVDRVTQYHLDPGLVGDPCTILLPVLAEKLTLIMRGIPSAAGQLTLLPAPLPFVQTVAAVRVPTQGVYSGLDALGNAGVLLAQPALLQRLLITNTGSTPVLVTLYDKATTPSFDTDPQVRNWVIGPGATCPLEMPPPGLNFRNGVAATFKDPLGAADPTTGLFVSLEFR